MTTTAVVILLLLVAFAVGCMAMRGDVACNATPPTRARPDANDGATIDPADDHQIGLLIGMTGGTVTDAAIARSALQRFEAEQGRRATTRDLGIVVGMMRAMQ